MTDHKVIGREEWQAARDELLQREKEHTRMGDELARQRRELPWVVIEKEYLFDTDEGTRTLAGLFDGRSQLLIYHFMFGPSYQAGCPVNSSMADGLDGLLPHLHARDVTLLLVSQAPLAKLQAYKQRMSWRIPWVSAANTDFNYDYGASYTEEQVRSWGLDERTLPPIVAHNVAATGTSIPGYLSESPAMSAFTLQDGAVYQAEADRGVSVHRRIPGQGHAADSGVHADPSGLTCDESGRLATLVRPRRSRRRYMTTAALPPGSAPAGGVGCESPCASRVPGIAAGLHSAHLRVIPGGVARP